MILSFSPLLIGYSYIFFGKYLFRSFVYFPLLDCLFLSLSYKSSLYILNTAMYRVIGNIVCFEEEKFLILMKSILSIFSFDLYFLYPMIFCLTQGHSDYSLCIFF